MAQVTMARALNQALRDAITASEDVLVFGEDVGALGGVFRITDGIAADLGEDRCFDTPLAEAGIMGFAVGMCFEGYRPVVEMQFDAFAFPAFEQVVSHVAKMRNRTRGALPLPLVIRVPSAGGIGGVEHHCDSSEGYYAHTPGLTVLYPSTPRDAYVLLRQAIDSPDPVVLMEPKHLYWSKAELDLDALRTEYETSRPAPGSAEAGRSVTVSAQVVREGGDATLIAYGPQVPTALKAAQAAAELGYDCEVIDLRSLQPFDDETVCASVQRTGRAVVISEAPGFAGVAAEVAARVSERCFHSLAAPVLRVSGFDIPYPAPKLEHTHLPSVDRVLDAIERLQWDDEPDLTHAGGTR